MEGELGKMISGIKNPPADMKKMQKDQKPMQDDAGQIQADIGKMKGTISKWQGDMGKFQNKKKPDGKLDSYAIYDGLVPIIKTMEVLTKDLIKITEKFCDQGQRYVDFGQSMLDSGSKGGTNFDKNRYGDSEIRTTGCYKWGQASYYGNSVKENV